MRKKHNMKIKNVKKKDWRNLKGKWERNYSETYSFYVEYFHDKL